jgi:hypothetical protein
MPAPPRVGCLVLAVLVPAVGAAQDVTARFRLVAAPNNITGCIAGPPSLTVEDKNLGCKWMAKKE